MITLVSQFFIIEFTYTHLRILVLLKDQSLSDEILGMRMLW